MRVSRLPAPGEVGKQEASEGDMPKQGSGPQRDLRDDAIIAQVLVIIYAECDSQKTKSNAAKEQASMSDMYRHNTALGALWDVAAKIGAITSESPADERDGCEHSEPQTSTP